MGAGSTSRLSGTVDSGGEPPHSTWADSRGWITLVLSQGRHPRTTRMGHPEMQPEHRRCEPLWIVFGWISSEIGCWRFGVE
jgi:hypothetical protein